MFPETRNSLILRLSDCEDAEAWDQFVAIYESLIFSLSRKMGLQHADCSEVVQEVLLSVSNAVNRWVPDENRGRFRTWLYRIVKNEVLKRLTRRKHQSLGTGEIVNLDSIFDANSFQLNEDTYELEYRRHVFRWASGQVQKQVADTTWNAFWKTSVEEATAKEAAEELGMTVGAVHIARNRVRGRLKKLVAKYESESDAAIESLKSQRGKD